jgi:hypothetical protein
MERLGFSWHDAEDECRVAEVVVQLAAVALPTYRFRIVGDRRSERALPVACCAQVHVPGDEVTCITWSYCLRAQAQVGAWLLAFGDVDLVCSLGPLSITQHGESSGSGSSIHCNCRCHSTCIVGCGSPFCTVLRRRGLRGHGRLAVYSSSPARPSKHNHVILSRSLSFLPSVQHCGDLASADAGARRLNM